MQNKFVDTNNIKLHYLEYEGDGPTLILMHGLTANAHAFDGLMAAGLNKKYTIIAVDLRGRGLSDFPANGYTMKEHAADIIGLLDALKLDKVILGGHSFGALLTLYIAAHFAERVDKMILIDAAAKLHPKVKEMLVPTLSRLGQTFSSFEAYISKVKQAPYITEWHEEMLSYYKADVKTNEDGTVTPRPKMDNMTEAVLKGSLGEPWEQLIANNDKPTILINACGVYTLEAPLLPEELARETVEMMKDCKYIQVEGNHQTMLYGQGAEQIVEAISNFIG